MMLVKVTCKMCHDILSIKVPIEGYLAWQSGTKHIQDAMPQVPEGDRELLMSGICESCFDRMFGE